MDRVVARIVKDSMVAFLADDGLSHRNSADNNPFVRSKTPPISCSSFWNEEKLVKKQHRLLCDLALAMLVTPASEASCERALSRMKYVVGGRRSNLQPSRLFAMLVVTE
jgi:hypothetical protein